MNDLILGWTLNGAMAPAYWMTRDPRPGSQGVDDLVRVSAPDIAHHTVIVAQSGSGKSFFLGRLIEEVILRTRARVVVLDPNGDYRRLREVVPESCWTSAQYDPASGRGKLPHEASRAEFESMWARQDLQLRSGPYSTPRNSEPLRISWSTFPIAFLAEDLDSIARSQVYHCHEFVKSIAALDTSRERGPRLAPAMTESRRRYPLDKARKLLQRARHEGARETLEEEFPAGDRPVGKLRLFPRWRETALYQARERAVSAVEFISPEIERFYFGRAKEYVADGVVADGIQADTTENYKARIVDLPSFRDSRTQQVILSSVVETIWARAHQDLASAFDTEPDQDQRVPVFVVLEEAHNMIPLQTHSFAAGALREQFRTIAAEGRKYGVFLILCTQRPDKLDPAIISECENKAVMRLGARSVLDRTKELLGLETIADHKLQKCLEFQTGRFLLSGAWSGEDPKFGYSAMRRTVEGGRNLRPGHWASQEMPVDGPGLDGGSALEAAAAESSPEGEIPSGSE